MKKCVYRKGYKYQLDEDLWAFVNISDQEVETDFIRLETSGKMTLKKGYAWDGATWFPDFKWIIRASAFHDAGYQLLALNLIKRNEKDTFDMTLKSMCIQDSGKLKFLIRPIATAIYKVVSNFGSAYIKRKPLHIAP